MPRQLLGLLRLGFSVILLLAVALGCRVSDSTYSFEFSDLNSLGRIISNFSYEECKQFKSLSDIRVLAVERRLTTAEIQKMREIDKWGNEIMLKIDVWDDRIVIRLVSKGKNGIFENGEGDDMTCEVTIRKLDRPERKITYRGYTRIMNE